MYDPDERMRRINAKLAMLGGGGQLPASADQQSMIDSVISGGLTGLQYLGETLDKPMRAIRGTINGLTDLAQGESYDDANFGGGLLNLIPFSDTMQLTDASKAVYGRDMLENVGLADQNQEGLGGKDWSLLDPSSYGNIDLADAAGDLAGFGIDLINVPLLTGTKAVTNSGRALKNAGVLDDATRQLAFETTRRAGRAAVKSGTVDDAVQAASRLNPASLDNLTNYASKNNLNVDDLMNQRVGYKAGVWNPFAAEGITPLDPVFDAINSVTPKPIQKLGGKLLDLYDDNPLSNNLRQAFSADADNYNTFDYQTRVGPHKRRRLELEAINPSNQFVAQLTNELGGTPERLAAASQLGGGDTTTGIYRNLELDDDQLAQFGTGFDSIRPAAQTNNDEMARVIAMNQSVGNPAGVLDDEEINYARRMMLGRNAVGDTTGNMSGFDPTMAARSDHFKNVPGGTGAIREAAKKTASATEIPDIASEFESILQPRRQLYQGQLDTLASQVNDVNQTYTDAIQATMTPQQIRIQELQNEMRSLAAQKGAATRGEIPLDVGAINARQAEIANEVASIRATDNSLGTLMDQRRQLAGAQRSAIDPITGQLQDVAQHFEETGAIADDAQRAAIQGALRDQQKTLRQQRNQTLGKFAPQFEGLDAQLGAAKLEDAAQHYAAGGARRPQDEWLLGLPEEEVQRFRGRVDEIRNGIEMQGGREQAYGAFRDDALQELGNQTTEAKASLKAVQEQPDKIAATLLGLPEDVRKAGVYVDPIGEAGRRSLGGRSAYVRSSELDQVLQDPTLAKVTPGEAQTRVADLLKQLGRTPERIAEAGDATIDSKIAQDIMTQQQKLSGPATTTKMNNFLDRFNTLFSALNTNINPGFSVRNSFAGRMSNFLNGGKIPFSQSTGSQIADAITTNAPLSAEQTAAALSLPEIDAAVRRLGNIPAGAPLPDDVTPLINNAVRELQLGYLGPLNREGKSLDHALSPINVTAEGIPTADSVFDVGMAGGLSGNKAFSMGGYLDAANPVDVEKLLNLEWPLKPGAINPFAVEGAGEGKYLGMFGKKRTSTEFAPSKAGNILDSRVEAQNRLGPFLDRMLEGMPGDEAAKQVNASQISYAPRNYTNFENEVMRRIVPFYAFRSGNLKNIATDLIENPGGRRATLYKSIPNMQRVAGTDDDPLPPHVRESIGLPLGTAADGTIRALTGLGLGEEDPLGFIDPKSPIGLGTDTLYEMMGSLNPLIKAPIEAVTGKSLFQKGVMGPKDTADLDPTLSRIALNVQDTLNNLGVMDSKPLTEYQLKSMTGLPTIEAAVANSPFAKMTRLLRVMTDPRKNPEWAGGTDTMPLPLASAANLLTGLRVSDVPINSQEKALSEMIQQSYQDTLGARTMSRPYVPQYIKEGMSPEMLQQDEAFQSVLNLIDQRRRQRKQAQMGM